MAGNRGSRFPCSAVYAADGFSSEYATALLFGVVMLNQLIIQVLKYAQTLCC